MPWCKASNSRFSVVLYNRQHNLVFRSYHSHIHTKKNPDFLEGNLRDFFYELLLRLRAITYIFISWDGCCVQRETKAAKRIEEEDLIKILNHDLTQQKKICYHSLTGKKIVLGVIGKDYRQIVSSISLWHDLFFFGAAKCL